MGEETKDTATFEDKFRITVDKNVNWDASEVADPDGDGDLNTGYVQILKFTPASTGSFTYVSECSNRGLCNGDDALCECSRATPTTTATRRARSLCKAQARGLK